MKRLVDEVKGLVWTLAGTGLVLITLSGQTRTYGLWISVIALLIHLAAVGLEKDGGDSE